MKGKDPCYRIQRPLPSDQSETAQAPKRTEHEGSRPSWRAVEVRTPRALRGPLAVTGLQSRLAQVSRNYRACPPLTAAFWSGSSHSWRGSTADSSVTLFGRVFWCLGVLR